MRHLLALAVAVAVGITVPAASPFSPALAHDVEKGPRGGPVVESKGLHLELVVKGDEINVFLTNKAHADLSSKGATARAVVLAGGKQITVSLEPKEPNLLVGKAEAKLGAGARVVVSAKLATGEDLMARFAIK